MDAIQQAITDLERKYAEAMGQAEAFRDALGAIRRAYGVPTAPEVCPMVPTPTAPPRPTERLPRGMGDTLQDAALAALETRSPQATSEIAAALGRSPRYAADVMVALRQKGLIHRTGTGPRNYRWHLGKGSGPKEGPSCR